MDFISYCHYIKIVLFTLVINQDEDIKAELKNQDYLINLQHYSNVVLKIKKSQRAVIFNGRIIGPLDDDEEFTYDDFSLLERFSYSTYGHKLFNHLKKNQLFEDLNEYGRLNKLYV